MRSQNRGSWVCPIHLDYCQVANTCISRVFTWFQARTHPKLTFDLSDTQRCVKGQSSGIYGCPIHLEYCQVADTCISCVFMWFQAITHACICFFLSDKDIFIFSAISKVTLWYFSVLKHTLKRAQMHRK